MTHPADVPCQYNLFRPRNYWFVSCILPCVPIDYLFMQEAFGLQSVLFTDDLLRFRSVFRVSVRSFHFVPCSSPKLSFRSVFLSVAFISLLVPVWILFRVLCSCLQLSFPSVFHISV